MQLVPLEHTLDPMQRQPADHTIQTWQIVLTHGLTLTTREPQDQVLAARQEDTPLRLEDLITPALLDLRLVEYVTLLRLFTHPN